MKILVTGASGFIASHVIDHLHSLGHNVIFLDRKSPLGLDQCDVPFNFQGMDQYVVGDLQDAGVVSEAIAYSDGVLHVAGVLGTSETIDNPLPAVQTNILGGLNVLQGIKQHKKRGVYITVGNYWMENTYSITKTTMERFVYMFNNEHGTEVAVVRALNAYGPRQKSKPVRKIMPNFILPALRNEPITIYGDGSQVMDMVPVEFVAEVMVKALLVDHGMYRTHPLKGKYGDPDIKFDCGSGRATTVNQIAQTVIDVVGQGSVQHVDMRAGEPVGSVVLGDPTSLKPLFNNHVPVIESLESGVARTVEYYREHMDA